MVSIYKDSNHSRAPLNSNSCKSQSNKISLNINLISEMFGNLSNQIRLNCLLIKNSMLYSMKILLNSNHFTSSLILSLDKLSRNYKKRLIKRLVQMM
jgi:hypothetical protein